LDANDFERASSAEIAQSVLEGNLSREDAGEILLSRSIRKLKRRQRRAALSEEPAKAGQVVETD
jgi:hypothetical protein